MISKKKLKEDIITYDIITYKDEDGKDIEYVEVTLVDRIIDVYMDTREVNIGILANKIIDISATSENHEQNTAGSYFDWKFGNIYYEKYGEGKPVLLIHDFSVGSSS